MKRHGPNGPAHQASSRRSLKRVSLPALVWSLVKAHSASYIVMSVTVCLTSLLFCSTLQVYMAGRMQDGIGKMGSMHTLRRLMAETPYRNVVMISTVSVLCIGLISIFLVLASVSFLVQDRRREFGMMRLNGASRTRIMVMELCEFALPLALTNIVGSLLGSVLAVPMGKAFSGPSEFPGSGVSFDLRVRPSVTVLSFAFMMVVCLLGVWLAIRKLNKVSPLGLMAQESAKGAKKMGKLRIVISCPLVLLSLFVGFAPTSLPLDMRCMLLVILVICTVYAASPLLVAGSVSLLGLIPEKLASGPGILARQRARRETAGSTAVALPVMMVLTIVISFLAVFQAGSIGGNMLNLQPLKADVIVSSDTEESFDELSSTIRDLGDEVRGADIYTTQTWAVENPSGPFQVAWQNGTDGLVGDGARRATAPEAVEGSLSDLGPGKIAVSNQNTDYRLGDKVTLIDRSDKRYQLTVAAIVRPPEGTPPLPMDFLSSADGLPHAGEEEQVLALISASSPSAISDITKAIRGAGIKGMSVETRSAFIDRFLQRGVSGQHALSVMIVGGTALAIIFLLQSIAIALSERQGQNRRLYQIGVSRQSIVWSAVLETGVNILAGALIAVVAICVVVAAVALAFSGIGLSVAYTPIPLGPFCLVGFLLLVIGVAATLMVSYGTLKSVGSN